MSSRSIAEQLLELPPPDLLEWIDYPALSITREHVTELIELVNPALLDTEVEFSAGYVDVHAWRALGQLHAEAAIQPLIAALERADDDDDWACEDLPRVFEMIGPRAAQPLGAYLTDQAHGMYARATAADALTRLAQSNRGLLSQVVRWHTAALSTYASDDPGLNALLVSNLIELGAKDAAPLIREIYEAGCADVIVNGDWEDVQADLGITPARRKPLPSERTESDVSTLSEDSRSKQAAKARAKRRAARHSRRKNRRKN